MGTACVAYSPGSRRGTSDGNTAKSHRHSRGNSCVVSVTSGDGNTDTDTPSPIEKLLNFATQNYFLLGMCFAVFAAYLHPGFGANGGPLKPEITVSKLAVRVMFLISGLSLPLTELRAAVANVKANLLIQVRISHLPHSASLIAHTRLTLSCLSYQSFIFGVAGFAVTFLVAPLLSSLGVMNPSLINGLIILACLPTTIGTGVAMTNAAGGNAAVAIFHAVFSNVAGVVLTPALIFFYLGFGGSNSALGGAASGATLGADFTSSLGKLASSVLQPVSIGMWIRSSARFAPILASKPAKRKMKLISDLIILAIVYNTFCNTFVSRSLRVTSGIELGTLCFVLSMLLVAYKAAVFGTAIAVGLKREDVVAATFMGSQKTLAFGLPLINALFGSSPDLVWFCLPILVYHPLQTFLGSALVPKLRRFVEEGKSD